jgi:hypothetical protein
MPVSRDTTMTDLSPQRCANVDCPARTTGRESRTRPEAREPPRLPQAELAKLLRTAPATLVAIKARPDMLVSTLGEIVEGFGGTLHLVAELPDHLASELRLAKDRAKPLRPNRPAQTP